MPIFCPGCGQEHSDHHGGPCTACKQPLCCSYSEEVAIPYELASVHTFPKRCCCCLQETTATDALTVRGGAGSVNMDTSFKIPWCYACLQRNKTGTTQAFVSFLIGAVVGCGLAYGLHVQQWSWLWAAGAGFATLVVVAFIVFTIMQSMSGLNQDQPGHVRGCNAVGVSGIYMTTGGSKRIFVKIVFHNRAFANWVRR